MESDWTQAKLGDYIDSCLGKMLDKNKNTGEYHPYLGNSNVRWGEFELDDLAEMKFEAHEHTRYGLKKGDLIICEGGEPGRCAIWEDEIPNMKIQKALHRVRTLSGLDSEYLYYWFLFSTRAGHIEPFFTGTTIKHLTGKALKEIPIRIPPLTYQQYSAKLLRGIDKKITLNRQINQTLEHMAQALFKSWFVDFDPVVDNALDAGFFEQDLEFSDELLRRAEARKAVRENADFKPLPEDIRQLFPSAFEECAEPSLGFSGWVPQGWIAAPLTTVANIVYGKNLPKTKILNEGYPVYGGNGVIGSYSHYLYKKPQVLISCRGAASGKVHWTKPFCFVTNNSLVIEEKNISSLYIYYSLLQQDLTNLTSGSAQPQMTIANLNPVNVLLPKNEIISRFVRHAQDLQTSCEARKIECEMLSTLRDTLLPKLISGELRLSASEIEAADDVLA